MIKVLQPRYGWALLLAAIVGANPAYAEKPAWTGGGKHQNKEQHERGDDRERGGGERPMHEREEAGFRREPYFNGQHRNIIREYYAEQYRGGSCPPGLAKKHNGCMPPGQARKWAVGQPLPPDVVYYEVPAGMIGNPPPGYRFVRVASDILMIAIGTGMVVDALTDLNGW